ncbi:MAG TPA: hypothetical protein P5136_02320 [Methanofastidiosum sp.]|nr:hypothetical protein [Methanofastidiosum sp.]
MEQRKTVVDPNTVDLSQQNFITGDSFPKSQTPNVLRPTVGPPPQQKVVLPDMHQEGIGSNPQTRQEALSRVDQLYTSIDQEIVQQKIEDDIQTAKQSPFSAALATSPRDILKQLIAKGDYCETVKLYNHNWTLRALDQRDLILAAEMLKDDVTTRTAQVSAIMFLQVIFSIEAVDGISVYEWFPDIKAKDYKDRESYNLAVKRAVGKYLEHVGPQVIDDFYKEYQKIEEKRNEGLAQLKNS